MKKFALIVATLALGAAASGAIACPDEHGGACALDKHAAHHHAVKAADAKHDMQAGGGHVKMACIHTTQLEVKGMECADCATKVSKGLKAVKGVEGVNIDLDHGVASVDYCSKELKDTSLLLKAVQKAGFEAKLAAAAPKVVPAADTVKQPAAAPAEQPAAAPVAPAVPADKK